MCECGCGDYNPICKFRGPDNLTYVVQIYAGCQGCCTPAGVILYAFTDKDMEEWDANVLPEREILYEGTALPVIDPVALKRRMADMYGKESDAAYLCEEAVDTCFTEAVDDTTNEGRKILAEETSMANPKLLKWARRSARLSREKAEFELSYRRDLAILRMKENGALPVSMYEVRQMARLYKCPLAAFELPRVPFRWYIEALGWPRKKEKGE